MGSLADAVRDWHPEPVSTTDTIMPGPVTALAGLFDQPPPTTELPPLWHWVFFLDRFAEHELGPEGHPLKAGFLPPIPDRRRMYAGGRLTLHAPFLIGATLTRRSSLAAVTPKTGRTGELLFTTVRHEYVADSDQALVAVEEQDVVYRSGDAPRVSRPSSKPSSKPAEEDWPWRIDIYTDPVLLFRFSALTYNAHRIHYDLPYTVEVEGHDGLVVHGPLLAMLLAELPRRAGHLVRSLEFRLKAPLYCGLPAQAVGGPDRALQVLGSAGVHATMEVDR